MNLKEMKEKILTLMEEANPQSPHLSEDADIQAKLCHVLNQNLAELARMKKIPCYVALEVSKGETVTFDRIAQAAGGGVYQLGPVGGVACESRAGGTVLVALETGTLHIDCYLYPEAIAADTADSYEFMLSRDALELLPYAVAGDLLKNDPAAQYGAVYAARYNELLQRLDSRFQTGCFQVEGGVDI